MQAEIFATIGMEVTDVDLRVSDHQKTDLLNPRHRTDPDPSRWSGRSEAGTVVDVSGEPVGQPDPTGGGDWPHVTVAYGHWLCILDDNSVAHGRRSCRRRKERCRRDTPALVEPVRT